MCYHFNHSYIHRRSEAELLPLDTELERTLKNLKKVRIVAKLVVMADQEETNKNELVAVAESSQR